MKKISLFWFSGLARIRIAPTCATASVRIVGGSADVPRPSSQSSGSLRLMFLIADDPLVQLELGDAIHQQERVAMRQDPLDGLVVERQRQGHDRHPV